MLTPATELANYLEGVVSGEPPLEEAVLSPQRFGRALEPVICNLHHFFSDGDIRATDPAYAAMQPRSMRRLIVLLKQDAPIEQLAEVTFLEEPE